MPNSPLTHDRVFRHVFGEPEGLPLLKSLINAYFEYLKLPLVESLELLSPDLGPELIDEKRTVLDVLAQDETGRKVNVEIQTVRKASYPERALFNWARLYGRQLPAGEDFTELRPVILLHFLEYDFDPGLSALHEYRLPLTDDLVIVFVELVKLSRQSSEDLNPAEVWAKFIERPTPRWADHAPTLAPALWEAQERLEAFMALTPDVVREIFQEKWELDQLTMKNQIRREARAEGLAEGRAEGQAEERLAIARRMREAGLSAEQICDLTGLTVTELSSGEPGSGA